MTVRNAPYGQLDAVDVLILSSFIYLLNIARRIADYLIHAGSVGEIIVGMIYGAPIAQLLHPEWQKATHDLGYIGLILLLFEGGLYTRLESLQRNFFLSLLVASTGVIFPIGLSFLLLCVGYGYSINTAFACAAALATTSLGTTFFILSTQSPHSGSDPNLDSAENIKDIRHTQIGSVLLSAALIDDVIGLVLVTILPTVNSVTTDSNYEVRGRALIGQILRPIGVSAALFIVVAVRPFRTALVFVIRRVCDYLLRIGRDNEWSVMLFVLVATLSGFVAGAFYAGASLLLGAWVAGCLVGHADEVRWAEEKATDPEKVAAVQLQELALQRMTTLQKLPALQRTTTNTEHPTRMSFRATYEHFIMPLQTPLLEPFFFASIGYAVPFLGLWTGRVIWRGLLYAILMAMAKMAAGLWILVWPVSWPRAKAGPPAAGVSCADSTKRKRPVWPTLFLSIAMVARGEIGLIVAQLGGLSGEPYLVVMWAIMLCTVGGAVSVGSLLRRRKGKCTAGVWG